MGIGHPIADDQYLFIGFLFSMCVMQNIYAQSEGTDAAEVLELQPHNARLQASVALFNALRGE